MIENLGVKDQLVKKLSQELRGIYIWTRKKSVILVSVINVTVKNVVASATKKW